MIYLNFFENTEKVKPTQISTTLQCMSKIFQIWQFLTFMCPFITGRKAQPQKVKIFKSADMGMPKNQQQASYYRTDNQTISKARTILSENYSSS